MPTRDMFVALALCCCANAAAIADSGIGPRGVIERLGFSDQEHTRDDGYRYSDPLLRFNSDLGFVVSASSRFEGAESRGRTAWAWSPDTGYIKLGLLDGDHINSAGSRSTFLSNDYPLIGSLFVGTSSRYFEDVSIGQTAWIWTPENGSVALEPTIQGYEREDGKVSSSSLYSSPSGFVFGTAVQPSGAGNGRRIWGWSEQSGYHTIGLIDARHTSALGVNRSTFRDVNDSGMAVGTSEIFPIQRTGTGQSAWVWSESLGTLEIGLDDAMHSDELGGEDYTNLTINNAGRIAGQAEQYGNNAPVGQSVWTWTEADGASRIGYYDKDHSNNLGYSNNSLIGLTETGHAIGYAISMAFNDSGGSRDAWAWDSENGEQIIGLRDAEHVHSSGYRYDTNVHETEAGIVYGESYRFLNGRSRGNTLPDGRSAWVWSPGSPTVRVGLDEPQHVSSTGFNYNTVTQANNTGVVAGNTWRYDEAGFRSDAWVHNAITGETYKLDPGFEPEEGLEYDAVLGGVNDDAVVYGIWSAFVSETFQLVDVIPFFWTAELGVTLLDDLVPGRLADHGWTNVRILDVDLENQLVYARGAYNGAEDLQPFIVHIPAPPSLIIPILGITALRRRR